MLTSLASLAVLAATTSTLPRAESSATEVTSAGPGLALRATASLVNGRHTPLRFALLHAGWEVVDGVASRPSRYGAAVGALSAGEWLEARGLELDAIESARLGTKSLYVNPVALTLRHHVTVVPGSFELSARLDLTLSLWQSTQDLAATTAAPLPCSSGSIAQATIEATIRHDLTVGLVAGASDDPVHFDNGADCLGGGDVWRSSGWVGARATAELGGGFALIVEAGRSFEELHSVVEAPNPHPGDAHEHEHVALRSTDGLEAGAWLAASF